MSMAILGIFETAMKQKQSGYLSQLDMIQQQQQQTNQWVLTSVQFNLVKNLFSSANIQGLEIILSKGDLGFEKILGQKLF